MYCCTAGGMDLPILQRPSKPNFDGFSLEEPMLTQHAISPLHFTTLLLPLVVT